MFCYTSSMDTDPRPHFPTEEWVDLVAERARYVEANLNFTQPDDAYEKRLAHVQQGILKMSGKQCRALHEALDKLILRTRFMDSSTEGALAITRMRDLQGWIYEHTATIPEEGYTMEYMRAWFKLEMQKAGVTYTDFSDNTPDEWRAVIQRLAPTLRSLSIDQLTELKWSLLSSELLFDTHPKVTDRVELRIAALRNAVQDLLDHKKKGDPRAA